MKLATKLPLVIAAALLSTALAGSIGMLGLNRASESYVHLIDVEIANERRVQDTLATFKTQVQEWKNVLLRGKDAKALDKYWGAFAKEEAKVQQLAGEIAKNAPEGELRSLAERFGKEHATMGVKYRQGLERFKEAGGDSAVGDAAVKGMDRAPSELLSQLTDKIAAASQSAVEQASQARDRAIQLAVALMLAAVAFGTVVAWFFARSVTRQLGGEPDEARQIATAIAGGDLTVHVPVNSGDNSSLMASIAGMQQGLSTLVQQVRMISDSIATGSTQISVGSHDLSERNATQAGAVQRTAATVEEFTATVASNAEHAGEADRVAREASGVAASGGAVVSEVVQTMQGIRDSSKRIAEITDVIDGIAFQTNILALNAAVEAARAGEQGRGFAVVAGEVRMLAQRSADAARQISALIQESEQRVQAGTTQVSRAGQTMQDVVRSIGQVSELVGQISLATSEQRDGMTQVSSAVNSMDSATQQNAALVEESTAAALSLSQQAKELVTAVSVFRLPQSQPALAR